ncbi:hypothetical protein GC194_13820 [bacterium]|nr:hypothetical protein [bacterium]
MAFTPTFGTVLQKVTAIFLALLVLIANLGMSVNTHFCGGKAVQHQLSLGIIDLDCGMGMDAAICDMESEAAPSIAKQACCSNEHLQMQTDENFTFQKNEAAVSLPMIATLMVVFAPYLAKSAHQAPHHSLYSPPQLHPNIRVLIQSFLK